MEEISYSNFNGYNFFLLSISLILLIFKFEKDLILSIVLKNGYSTYNSLINYLNLVIFYKFLGINLLENGDYLIGDI